MLMQNVERTASVAGVGKNSNDSRRNNREFGSIAKHDSTSHRLDVDVRNADYLIGRSGTDGNYSGRNVLQLHALVLSYWITLFGQPPASAAPWACKVLFATALASLLPLRSALASHQASSREPAVQNRLGESFRRSARLPQTSCGFRGFFPPSGPLHTRDC